MNFYKMEEFYNCFHYKNQTLIENVEKVKSYNFHEVSSLRQISTWNFIHGLR